MFVVRITFLLKQFDLNVVWKRMIWKFNGDVFQLAAVRFAAFPFGYPRDESRCRGEVQGRFQ